MSKILISGGRNGKSALISYVDEFAMAGIQLNVAQIGIINNLLKDLDEIGSESILMLLKQSMTPISGSINYYIVKEHKPWKKKRFYY